MHSQCKVVIYFIICFKAIESGDVLGVITNLEIFPDHGVSPPRRQAIAWSDADPWFIRSAHTEERVRVFPHVGHLADILLFY